MKPQARTIRVFLADGTPTGIMTAEIIAAWTGKAIVAPRARLAELLSRPEVARTGVYVLSGQDPEDPSRTRIYIGEADSIRTRLIQHNADPAKDFFTRALVVVSKDENLTKGHARFLESRLIALARTARRATLANGTSPDFTLLPESDTADMEFFVDQITLVLPLLGFDFVQALVTTKGTSPAGTAPDVFEFETVGVSARAIETDDGFVVLEGSTARLTGNPSWDTYRKLRDRLIGERKLVEVGSNILRFADDVAFSSPSAAAAVVYAGNQNGRTAWRLVSDGRTYNEWQEERIIGEQQSAKPEI